MLIRFRTMKRARLGGEDALFHADGDDVVSDVRRVFPMMCERCLRNLRGRCAMRKSDRAERRTSDRRNVDRYVLVCVLRSELHEEIVRMLRVAQRTSERRLTGLKELGITAIGDRRRLEAEHRVEQQMSISDGPLG